MQQKELTRLEYEDLAFTQNFNVPKVIDDLFGRIEKMEDLIKKQAVCVDCHRIYYRAVPTYYRCLPCFKKHTGY